MKNVFSLILMAFVVISFSSCKDDIKSCVEDSTGTYSGTQDCVGLASNAITFSVSESSDGDDKVLFNIEGDIVKATVNEDCDYTFDSTVIIDAYNNAITITGSGSFNEDQMNGTMILTTGTIGVTCNQTATRQ